MTDKCFWSLPSCAICGESIYDNQDLMIDHDEHCHVDCLNDNPDFFDPDETLRENAEAD